MTEMMLSATVRERTKLDGRYRESASWQSMQAYLDDWRAARARLDRQIAELTVMVERRRQQVRRGEWPPETAGSTPITADDALAASEALLTSTPPEPVVDLMAALERSVAEAKAARDRQRRDQDDVDA